MKTRLLAMVVFMPLLAFAQPFQVGPYRVDWRTDPAVVPLGKAKVVLKVTDSAGKPVSGVKLRVLAQMPGMAMGEREQPAIQDASGDYVAPAVFGMEGGYDLTVRADGPLGSGEAKASLSTGQKTSMESPAGQSTKAPWTAVLAVVTLVVISWFSRGAFRRSPTGQEQMGGKSIRPVVVSLILISACVYGAYWAVNNLRRPGSMTPLEAQVMQMDAPPPEGITPVTLGKVEQGIVQGTVRYPAQAAGFSEQDVFPRVTGTLIYMPFYAGDKIHKGQVLARLDRTQLSPMTEQGRAALAASEMGVQSSSADYRAASAMVTEAQSEEGQYKAAIEEAESNLLASQENLEAQKAMSNAADSDTKDLESQLVAAQADHEFNQAELERMKQLLAAGAISRSEFQRKEADAKKSTSAVNSMQSSVGSMEAKALAAKAQARSADAAVSAAQHKLEQAKNEMRVHLAHVTTAQATADSARSKIAQAQSMAQQAAGSLAAATANEAYSTIVSPLDGVVTQRLIPPGTLVQPGQSILKVAQIAPIRLQSNVASQDLSRIQIGAVANVLKDGKKVGTARITSVSPMVDSSTRTGLVEAMLPNKDLTWKPGQFLTLEIAIGGSAESSLSVPTEALQSGPSESQFVWVATPSGEKDRYAVKRVSVKPTATGTSRTSINGELTEGEWVVASGFDGLTDGVTVSNRDGGHE